MKRICELCGSTARIHCESDQASLCWDCDAKVHSANFLVARHSRNLLCRACQSPTPWSASGSKLDPTFTACRRCVTCDRSGGGVVEVSAAEEMEIQGTPWSPPLSESSSSSDDEVAVTNELSDV